MQYGGHRFIGKVLGNCQVQHCPSKAFRCICLSGSFQQALQHCLIVGLCRDVQKARVPISSGARNCVGIGTVCKQQGVNTRLWNACRVEQWLHPSRIR
mmetsp:Transcript_69750/g.163207  ORF Transcript_69750/g.163207 Transcript_69750/m.163207 type:complete len:98 (-) Transcript_69750:151-444(-)